MALMLTRDRTVAAVTCGYSLRDRTVAPVMIATY
jgi:hypothetical protein